MALTNYTELQASVADWLNRQDLSDRIPDFIRLLESQVEREVRVVDQLANETFAIETDGTVTLPDDYLALNAVTVLTNPPGKPLEYVSRYELDHILATHPAGGIPRVYTTERTRLVLAPKPVTEGQSVRFVYWQRIPRLSTVTSNWLLEKHPDIYLYGTLMQAAPFLHNDERIGVWQSALRGILEAVNVQDERATRAGTPLKMRIGRPYGGRR